MNINIQETNRVSAIKFAQNIYKVITQLKHVLQQSHAPLYTRKSQEIRSYVAESTGITAVSYLSRSAIPSAARQSVGNLISCLIARKNLLIDPIPLSEAARLYDNQIIIPLRGKKARKIHAQFPL